MTADISLDDGGALVRYARSAVTERICNSRGIDPDPAVASRFSYSAGVFVTINDRNGLRGCIGHVASDQKLYRALCDASISAALDDPRFESVRPDELDGITFEVTVLTAPEEIRADPSEYPSSIRVGRDGLLVRSASRSGLLLPQVPIEYGWDEREFLGHACTKAGLSADSWLHDDLSVSKFQGIIFREKEPGGKIVRVEL